MRRADEPRRTEESFSPGSLPSLSPPPESEGLVAFSPIASGTPVALRSFAADSKSSGGQIGSSTQYGLDAFMAATGCSASLGSQAQLVSTLIGMSGPVTERAAATASAVRSCSLMWR